ncbi:hypothetical protein ONR57_11260 [Hoyosella sp. YIM 151337]|nr:hypothetical protein [Hoyosella sp. YIM 151337]MCW4353876.1 hypothetical protein [Hoyosella sp. YIM 151337]
MEVTPPGRASFTAGSEPPAEYQSVPALSGKIASVVLAVTAMGPVTAP